MNYRYRRKDEVWEDKEALRMEINEHVNNFIAMGGNIHTLQRKSSLQIIDELRDGEANRRKYAHSLNDLRY